MQNPQPLQPLQPPQSNDGTQSIHRAITILRVLATRRRIGWGLTDLTRACGLKKATTHRILARLVHERLVHRHAVGEHYFLGPMLAELALSIPGLEPFVEAAKQLVNELAHATQLICVLSLRSGDDFVVLARASAPRLHSELHEPGARRPLLTTAGGAAILLTLDAATQQRIVQANREQLTALGRSSIHSYLAMFERSRRMGCGANLGDVAPGLNALAWPAIGRSGAAFASLTLAGADDMLPLSRCDEVVLTLQRVAPRVAELAACTHPDLYATGITEP